MNDKRRFTRIAVDIPAALSFYQIEAYHTGSIANISLGGCFFPLTEELPLGELCQLTITVGEALQAQCLSLTGEIVRNDQAGAGISFINLSDIDRKELEKIIAYYSAT